MFSIAEFLVGMETIFRLVDNWSEIVLTLLCVRARIMLILHLFSQPGFTLNLIKLIPWVLNFYRRIKRMPSKRQELTNQVLHQPLLLRKLNSVWYVWLYQAFMEYFKNFIQFNSFIQWWNWSRRAGIIRNDIKWWTELSPQLLANCQLIFLVSSSGEIITYKILDKK